MSRGVVITVHRTLSALSQRSPVRVIHPHVFQRATVVPDSFRGIQNSSTMADTKGSKTFVLEEYNNVSVATSNLPKDAAKDLTQDELKEWAPFKVYTPPFPTSSLLQACNASSTDIRVRRIGLPPSPTRSPSNPTPPTQTTKTLTSSMTSPSTRTPALATNASDF